jgi:hypothetical protein
MRPLFLCCRAFGASTKYLYDKTFEMNLKFARVFEFKVERLPQ